MPRTLYRGRIDGEFEGFDDDMLFRLINGTYWVQTQYKYWYHYAYNPEVTVTDENGSCILAVAGNSVPVRQMDGVTESRIEGEFQGWQGESVYKLTNGQVWKQSRYKVQVRL